MGGSVVGATVDGATDITGAAAGAAAGIVNATLEAAIDTTKIRESENENAIESLIRDEDVRIALVPVVDGEARRASHIFDSELLLQLRGRERYRSERSRSTEILQ